jgi:hypothetical protein
MLARQKMPHNTRRVVYKVVDDVANVNKEVNDVASSQESGE